MTSRTAGARVAALVVLVMGLVVVLESFKTWSTCPTTPCGGFLQSISEYSGIDLGFGVVTALAGLALTVIGLASLRTHDPSRYATAAAALALLVVGTVVVSIVWMYIIPGEDKEFDTPPVRAIVVGIAGAVAFAASLRLRQTMPLRE